jgi:hypothetical protein
MKFLVKDLGTCVNGFDKNALQWTHYYFLTKGIHQRKIISKQDKINS